MLDDDELDSLILPMLRYGRDEKEGYKREPTTCRRFYLKRAEWCAVKLADAWLDGRAEIIQVKLPDLDEAGFPLNAMCVGHTAAHQFAETCKVLNHNFWVEFKRRDQFYHKNQMQLIKWGYDIPPSGVCDVLGYRSSTAAWMVTHPTGPVLLTKVGDEHAEDDIHKFLQHWAQVSDVPDHWWQKHEGVELSIDERAMPTLSPRRKRRPMDKSVRRFIGLNY